VVASFEQDRDLAIGLWWVWAKRAEELSDEQWTTETRLSGWTVRDVYVHVMPDVLIAMLAGPASDDDAKVTSAEMLRINADPVAAEPVHAQLAEMVREAAAEVDRAPPVAQFDSALPDAFMGLTGLRRDTVIPHPILDSVSLGASCDIAILEATFIARRDRRDRRSRTGRCRARTHPRPPRRGGGSVGIRRSGVGTVDPDGAAGAAVTRLGR